MDLNYFYMFKEETAEELDYAQSSVTTQTKKLCSYRVLH